MEIREYRRPYTVPIGILLTRAICIRLNSSILLLQKAHYPAGYALGDCVRVPDNQAPIAGIREKSGLDNSLGDAGSHRVLVATGIEGVVAGHPAGYLAVPPLEAGGGSVLRVQRLYQAVVHLRNRGEGRDRATLKPERAPDRSPSAWIDTKACARYRTGNVVGRTSTSTPAALRYSAVRCGYLQVDLPLPETPP